MVTPKIKLFRVQQICGELAIDPPLINILDEHPQEDGKTIFGRALKYGVVNIYRGSFEAAYRGALAKASDVVTAEALLETCAAHARHVLLHELWHCKQLAENRDLVLTRSDAEAEAAELAAANDHRWPDVVTFVDE